MTYTLTITGMHCAGCKNLLTMEFEDQGFENVTIDHLKGIGNFTSEEDKDAVESKLNEVFSQFQQYKFSNLNINN